MSNNRFIRLLVVCIISFCISACSSIRKSSSVNKIYLGGSDMLIEQRYTDLSKTLKLVVNYSAGSYDNETGFQFVPTVREFVSEVTPTYIREMGMELANVADYTLTIDIRTFSVSKSSKEEVESIVKLTYKLIDAAGETIIPTTTVNSSATAEIKSSSVLRNVDWLGAAKILAHNVFVNTSIRERTSEKLSGKHISVDVNNVDVDPTMKIPSNDNLQEENNWAIGLMVTKNYFTALRKIRWDKIADNLFVEQIAEQEQISDKTSLEHTVIRWYIQSAPQGADVSWRVISSSPEVSNTNSNFVGTTPYESTESFDIKGLTYDNSGNVQIEVTCEKSGYLPQRKRFNLRQAIDQKEISAKFNLIKDE